MERARVDEIIDRYGGGHVVETLREYLTEPRRDRIERVLAGRMQSVEIAIEAPSDPHNAAAVVRTAEALGVVSAHVIAAEGDALHKKKTTQGAYHWVETHNHTELAAFVDDVRRRGLTLVGACVDAAATLSDVPVDGPLCLMLGNESRGLSDQARAASDLLFRIPMVGMSESLNLSVSAAISLYDVLARRRANLGRAGDLDATALERLRVHYYVRSVDARLAETLFPIS